MTDTLTAHAGLKDAASSSHDSTDDSTFDTAAWTPPTWEEIVQQHSVGGSGLGLEVSDERPVAASYQP